MPMQKICVIGLLGIAFACVFCKKKTDDSVNGLVDRITPTGMVGLWKASCEASGSERSRKREIEINSFAFTVRESFFSDRECKQRDYLLFRHGSPSIQGPEPDTPALRLRVVIPFSYWDTYQGKTRKKEVNMVEYCATAEAAAELPADVFAGVCGADAFPQWELFDIFMVEGKRLRFGDLHNAEEATRPKTLRSVIFTKQE